MKSELKIILKPLGLEPATSRLAFYKYLNGNFETNSLKRALFSHLAQGKEAISFEAMIKIFRIDLKIFQKFRKIHLRKLSSTLAGGLCENNS